MATTAERPSPRASWITLWAVFALALGVRLIYLYQVRTIPFLTTPTVDGRFYDEWAQHIAGLGASAHADGVFFLAPAYPYFLAAIYTPVGRDLMTVHVVQMFLGAAGCLLIVAAGGRWFSRRAGLVAGLLLCFYPPAIFFDGILHKGGLLLSLTSLFLYLLSRTMEKGTAWTLVLCGLVGSLLALTQENMLVLLVVVPLWIALASPFAPWRRRLHLAGMFLAGMLPLLLLVAVRNYAVGSVFAVTTSNLGQNFYTGNNSEADGLYRSFVPGRQDPVHERDDAARIAEQSAGRSLTAGEVSAFWLRRGWQFIRQEPGAWVGLLFRKAVLIWNRFEAPDAEDIQVYAEWSPLLSALRPVFHFGVLAPLGIAGFVLTWDRWRRVGVLYLVACFVTASVALFFVFARFRLPLVPLLALGGGAGLASLAETLAARRTRRIAVAASAALGVAVVGNWRVVDERAYHSVGLVNLGSVLRQQGRLEEAGGFLERAVAASTDNELAWHQLGLVELARGRLARAAESFEKAAALQPSFADPHLALARMLVDANRPDEAVTRYRRAIDLQPTQRAPRRELAALLDRMGRRDEAIREFRRLVQLSPNDPALRDELRRLTGGEPDETPPPGAQRQRLMDSAADAAAVGRLAEAMEGYRKLLEQWPQDVPAHLGLAKAYLAAGQRDSAAEQFRRTIELDPAHAVAHIELGRMLADDGKLDAAIGHYHQALAADPTAIPARYNLATALAALGRRDEALAAMETCLQQARDAQRKDLIPWIEDRLARLRAERNPP